MTEPAGQLQTLVTHVQPDVDALVGLWVLTRFGPYRDFRLAFVPVGRSLNEPGAIHVDTGFSQFDHHQTDHFTCASKLVYDAVFAGRRDLAVERIVDYALKTDWYLFPESATSPFALDEIICGLNRQFPDDPWQVASTAFSVLDALYRSINVRILAEDEYKKGIEFDSIFGRAFAIESGLSHVRDLAHRKGASVFVFVDPERGYRGFKARAQEGVNFSGVYERLRELEPKADWFLHSSKELLLCGSPKAPDRRLSTLPLSVLVGLIEAPEATSAGAGVCQPEHVKDVALTTG